MAKRVNTKFVLLLAFSLLTLSFIMAACWYMFVYRSANRQIRLAEQYLAQGEYKLASDSYRRAVTRRRDDINLYYLYADTLGKVQCQDLHTARTTISKIIQASREALQLQPGNQQAFERLIDLQFTLARDFDASWLGLDNAAQIRIEYDPTAVLARRYRGIGQVMQRQSQNAPTEQRDSALTDLLAGLQVMEISEVTAETAQHDVEANRHSLETIYSLIRWHINEWRNEKRAGGQAELAEQYLQQARRLTEQVLVVLPETTDRLIYQAQAQLAIYPHPPGSPEALAAANRTPGERPKPTPGILAAQPIVDQLEQIVIDNIAQIDAPLDAQSALSLIRRIRDVATLLLQVGVEIIEDDDGNMVSTQGARRATALLEAARASELNSMRLTVYLARLHMRQGQREQATQLLQEAMNVKISGDPYAALEALSMENRAMYMYGDLLLQQASQFTGPDQQQKQKVVWEQVEGIIKDLITRETDETGDTYMLRGKLRFVQRELKEAANLLDKAVNTLSPSEQLLEALSLAGQAMVLTGEEGKAAVHYEQFLQLQENNVAIRRQLTGVYIRTRQFDAAAEQINLLMKRDPQEVDNRALFAAYLRATDKTAAALEQYEAILADHPETALQTVPIMAQIIAKDDALGGQVRARQMIDARFAANPDSLPWLRQLLRYVDDNEEALTYIDQARQAGADATTLDTFSQTYADDANVVTLLEERFAKIEDPLIRELGLSDLYRNTAQPEKSMQHLEAAAKVNPDDAGVIERQFNRALADGDLDRAAPWAERAAKNNTDMANGLFFAGRLLLARGEHEEAVSTLLRATERQSDSNGWRILGDAQHLTGDLTGAAISYQRALDQKPNNVTALRQFATLESRRGNHTAALNMLRQAYDFAPRDPATVNAYLGYEQAYGDVSRALKVRTDFAEAQPGNIGNRRGLALLLAQAKDYDKALQEIESVIADDGLTPINVEAKARILIASGQATAGVNLFAEYIEGLGDESSWQDWMRLARFLLQVGHRDQGMFAYQQAVDREDPIQRTASRELATMLFRAGERRRAAQLYRDIWQGNPSDRVVGIALVEALLSTNNSAVFDEAEQIINTLLSDLEQQQGSVLGRSMVLALRSTLEQQRGDSVQALISINRAVELAPTRAATYLRRAEVLRDDPVNQTQVRADLNRAIELNPQLLNARRLLIELHLRGAEINEAVYQLEQFLVTAANSPREREQLANLYAQLNRRQRLAELLDESAQMYPKDPTWPRLQATMALRAKDGMTAMAKYQQALDLTPKASTNTQARARVLGELVDVMILAEQYDEAISHLRNEPELARSTPVLLALRGRALMATGETDQARQAFILAIVRSPNEQVFTAVSQQIALALAMDQTYQLVIEVTQRMANNPAGTALPIWLELSLADLENQLGRIEQALSRLQALEPRIKAGGEQITAAITTRYDTLLAVAYHFNDQYEQAKLAYERVLAREATNVTILNNLAFLLAENLGDAQAALSLAQKAAQFAPRNADVMDTLGWVQYKADRPQEALDSLRQSLELRPAPTTYYHLGEVYVALEDPSRAAQMYESAAKTAEESNDTDTLDKAKQRLAELGQ